MIGVVGNVVLLVVGYATAIIAPAPRAARKGLTLWTWLEQRKREQVDAQTIVASPAA
jgi:hypothetical protein